MKTTFSDVTGLIPNRKFTFYLFLCMSFLIKNAQTQEFDRHYTYRDVDVEKIKVEEPADNITTFDSHGLQFVVPGGWEATSAGLSDYCFEESFGEIYLTNERGDQVWIWNELIFYDLMSIQEAASVEKEIIKNIIWRYAPIHRNIKNIRINCLEGPNINIYVWKACDLTKGKVDTVTIYTGWKEKPWTGPDYRIPFFFGRTAEPDIESKTEADIIEMAKYLQTYKMPESSKKLRESPDLDSLIQAILESKELIPLNESIRQSYQSISWEFQTDKWARYEEKIQENPVAWMLPSVITDKTDLNYEADLFTPNHILLYYKSGLEIIDTKSKELLWYRNLKSEPEEYGSFEIEKEVKEFHFILGNDERIIIYRENVLTAKGFLESYSTRSGYLLWSVRIGNSYGSPISWLLNNDASIISIIEEMTEEIRITGFDVNTGDQLWETSYELDKKHVSQPSMPIILCDKLLTFYDDIEAISLTTGKLVWRTGGMKLDENNPTPQVTSDSILIMDNEKNIHWLDTHAGKVIRTVTMDKSAEYTHIYPCADRIYIRGIKQNKNEPPEYFLHAINKTNGESLWSYSDRVATISNIIEDGDKVYVSTWQGPIGLNRNTGTLQFKTVVNTVSKTYPVTIQKYNDTIIYIGEIVIAGINSSDGEVLFWQGFNPVSQELNLEVIDPFRYEILTFLNRYGKLKFKGSTSKVTMGNFDRPQDNSTNLAKLSSQKYNDYMSTGSGVDLALSNSYHLQSQISRQFEKNAFANSLLLNASLNMLAARAEINKQMRKTLSDKTEKRERLMKLYQSQQIGNYVMRQTEEKDGNKIINRTAIIHLPSGKIIRWIGSERSRADVILNPVSGELYFHDWRLVPDLKEITEETSTNTAAHAPYLVAIPLNDKQD